MSFCLSTLRNMLTSRLVLKLWDTQGYLWLSHDLTEVNKLIEEKIEPFFFFFQKSTLCHSFRIIVIPSVLLSFLLNYCHSFRISAIPSKYCPSHTQRMRKYLQVIINSKFVLIVSMNIWAWTRKIWLFYLDTLNTCIWWISWEKGP